MRQLWRLTALLLALLNVLYYAWANDWLLAYGWGSSAHSELQQPRPQVRPEALIIVSPASAAAPAEVAAPASVAAQPQKRKASAAR